MDPILYHGVPFILFFFSLSSSLAITPGKHRDSLHLYLWCSEHFVHYRVTGLELIQQVLNWWGLSFPAHFQITWLITAYIIASHTFAGMFLCRRVYIRNCSIVIICVCGGCEGERMTSISRFSPTRCDWDSVYNGSSWHVAESLKQFSSFQLGL